MLLTDKHHLRNLESEKGFGERLAQTIYWCAARADVLKPRDSLRTAELRPKPFEESRFSAVETVAEARVFRGGDGILKARLPEDLAGGRLLAYLPDSNLFCGAAEDETGGFFDVDNVPPWDTWVAYFTANKMNSCLISWIPPQFVGLVSRGIYVNPEECIVWLENANIGVADELRRAWL